METLVCNEQTFKTDIFDSMVVLKDIRTLNHAILIIIHKSLIKSSNLYTLLVTSVDFMISSSFPSNTLCIPPI